MTHFFPGYIRVENHDAERVSFFLIMTHLFPGYIRVEVFWGWAGEIERVLLHVVVAPTAVLLSQAQDLEAGGSVGQEKGQPRGISLQL